MLSPELAEGVPRLSPLKALSKSTDDDFVMKLGRAQLFRKRAKMKKSGPIDPDFF